MKMFTSDKTKRIESRKFKHDSFKKLLNFRSVCIKFEKTLTLLIDNLESQVTRIKLRVERRGVKLKMFMSSYVSFVQLNSFKAPNLSIMPKILEMSPTETSNAFLPDELPPVSQILGPASENILILPLNNANTEQNSSKNFSNSGQRPTFASLRRYSTPIISSQIDRNLVEVLEQLPLAKFIFVCFDKLIVHTLEDKI